MAVILLLLFGGCEVVWEVPRVQAVVWIVPETVKPEPPPDPIPPPKTERQPPNYTIEAPKYTIEDNCANGNCGVRTRGIWRRRR